MSKKKFYYSVIIFFIVLLSITSVNTRAHPPDDMVLVYDSNTEILSVTITHGVADNTTHYIATVLITVNGSGIPTDPYYDQPSLTSFTYEYNITTNPGSIIQVTAICSVGGSLTKTLGGSTHGDIGIPGYIGLSIIILISTVIMLTFISRRLKRV